MLSRTYNLNAQSQTVYPKPEQASKNKPTPESSSHLRTQTYYSRCRSHGSSAHIRSHKQALSRKLSEERKYRESMASSTTLYRNMREKQSNPQDYLLAHLPLPIYFLFTYPFTFSCLPWLPFLLQLPEGLAVLACLPFYSAFSVFPSTLSPNPITCLYVWYYSEFTIHVKYSQKI